MFTLITFYVSNCVRDPVPRTGGASIMWQNVFRPDITVTPDRALEIKYLSVCLLFFRELLRANARKAFQVFVHTRVVRLERSVTFANGVLR